MPPDEFFAKDPETKAMMIIHVRSKRKLEAILGDERNREYKRQTAQARKGR
jgi:hypothetical protein